MRWQRVFGHWIPALGLVGSLACGGDVSEEAGPGSWKTQGPAEDRVPELNEAPVVEQIRIEPDEPAPGDRVRAVVRTRDPEGDRVTVGYTWSIGGRTLAEGGAEFELGEVSRGERLRVVAIASDGLDESEPASAVARVRNRRPQLTGLELEPGVDVPLGASIVAKPSAVDPDGDALDYRFEWTVNGRAVSAEGPRLETDRLRRGDSIQVRVWADDGDAESDPVYSQVVRIGNSRPEIVSTPQGLDPDGVFRYTIDARDADGDRNLRYYLSAGPEGMSVDPITGEVTWRPTHRHAGVHPVEVEVRDPKGGSATQSFELTVESSGAAPESESVPAAVQ